MIGDTCEDLSTGRPSDFWCSEGLPWPVPAPGTDNRDAIVRVSGTLLRRRITSTSLGFLTVVGRVRPCGRGAPPAGQVPPGTHQVQLILSADELGDSAASVAKQLPVGGGLVAQGHLYTTRAGRASVLCHSCGPGGSSGAPPDGGSCGPGAAGARPQTLPLCRNFARDGANGCAAHLLGECKFRHSFMSEAEVALGRAVAAKRDQHLEAEHHPDDPFSEEEKLCKPRRWEAFAAWLVAEFGGAEALSAGGGVVEVAGGNGALGLALASRGIRVTLVEPSPRAAPASHLRRFRRVPERGEVCRYQLAFGDELLLEWERAGNGTAVECSCIVGLHPDQVTETIVDVALRYNRPFAVVPCCVFASSFPHRRLPSRQDGGAVEQDGGRPVVSYADFLEYLRAKVERAGRACQLGFLPVKGKNRVLYSTA